jgi:hypothetical protein
MIVTYNACLWIFECRDCYAMWYPKTSRIYTTRDVIVKIVPDKDEFL